jgi:hypothetical protein
MSAESPESLTEATEQPGRVEPQPQVEVAQDVRSVTRTRTWAVVLIVGVLVVVAIVDGLEAGPSTPLEQRAEETSAARDERF